MQSAIAHAVHEIKRVGDQEIDIDAVALDDGDTYTLIQSTRTLRHLPSRKPWTARTRGKVRTAHLQRFGYRYLTLSARAGQERHDSTIS